MKIEAIGEVNKLWDSYNKLEKSGGMGRLQAIKQSMNGYSNNQGVGSFKGLAPF